MFRSDDIRCVLAEGVCKPGQGGGVGVMGESSRQECFVLHDDGCAS